MFHTYELAPLATRVAEPPAQIVDGDALTLIVGAALTNTVTVAVLEQPPELVPVTV